MYSLLMYVCCWCWDCVCMCSRAALTRSPKNTSLAVKGVRSHHTISLIHTVLASNVPVVESTWLGNTKLRHQLPASHYIGQGRTQINWITLSRSHVGICAFRWSKPPPPPYTHLVTWKTISDPSQWHPLPAGYSNHRLPLRLLSVKKKCVIWLTHSHLHMTVKSSYTCSQFKLSAFPKPHGHGW